ncbi:uncharacterized protein LOC27207034 [Drosophila simulans]|uniref:Uncharacterized protein n=1 Tax=Drosophila simulans TaxID=7240 RepID=A0A0J9RBJ5_DROSI|nr:uncharacterized protein LOC27207034 [Drosophila simulans]KMY93392.1 uncharacterized protein Dsimw501_GD27184 [Drosophila simulans]
MTQQMKETLQTSEDTSRDISVPRPTSSLIRLIRIEHNYNCIIPDKRTEIKSKRNLRQLVGFLNAEKNLGPLDFTDLRQHTLRADGILHRLRRFLASNRRFIDFRPMSVLQEAIVEHLAKEMRCSTRFYDDHDGGRYLVAYRPGIEPNSFELRAREVSPSKDFNQTMCQQIEKPESHQKTYGDHQMGHVVENSFHLGRKIFEKFHSQRNSLRRNEKT